MKKRVIFCLFISIYLLIYSNKNPLHYLSIKESPYLDALVKFVSFFFNEEAEISIKLEDDSIEIDTQESEKEYPYYVKKIFESGYDFEEHKILTEDGYILTAWRIPGKLNESQDERRQKRRPIILQHGLLDTSYTWLVLNSTDCLPLMLANNGYDVWLTNSRGNFLSLEHTNREYDSNRFYNKYWDFSFHEMAIYDLPANVFYIKNLTKWDKIHYIGHSQGTVQYFIQYTLNPDFIEENISKFVSIGTVVNVFNTTSKIVQFLEYTHGMMMLEKLYFKNILTLNEIGYNMIYLLCHNFNFICKPIVKYFLEDFDTNRIDYSNLFKEFYNLPGGTSARNINHWIQVYSTKQFTQFDFGRELNYLKYGQTTPPSYDITKFKRYKVKSLMTISHADPFSKYEDCKHVLDYINKDVYRIKELENYNHLDYLWSIDAKNDLYTDIIEFLK